MVQKVFITDRRRALLNDELDETKASIDVEKTRIRKRARMALAELIEVAESDAIDNDDVFDSDELGRLVMALFRDIEPATTYEGSIDTYYQNHPYEMSLFIALLPSLLAYNPIAPIFQTLDSPADLMSEELKDQLNQVNDVDLTEGDPGGFDFSDGDI